MQLNAVVSSACLPYNGFYTRRSPLLLPCRVYYSLWHNPWRCARRSIPYAEKVPELLAAVKERKELLHGFGHRVYKNRDPRAQMLRDVLKQIQDQTGSTEPLLKVAEEVDRLASQDPHLQKRGIYVNADLYTNFACMAM